MTETCIVVLIEYLRSLEILNAQSNRLQTLPKSIGYVLSRDIFKILIVE